MIVEEDIAIAVHSRHERKKPVIFIPLFAKSCGFLFSSFSQFSSKLFSLHFHFASMAVNFLTKLTWKYTIRFPILHGHYSLFSCCLFMTISTISHHCSDAFITSKINIHQCWIAFQQFIKASTSFVSNFVFWSFIQHQLLVLFFSLSFYSVFFSITEQTQPS